MSCCYCHSSPNTHYEKQGHWQSRKNERQVPKMVGIELFCWFSSLYISVAVALLSTTTENATKTFRYKIFSSDKYFVQNSILVQHSLFLHWLCNIRKSIASSNLNIFLEPLYFRSAMKPKSLPWDSYKNCDFFLSFWKCTTFSQVGIDATLGSPLWNSRQASRITHDFCVNCKKLVYI